MRIKNLVRKVQIGCFSLLLSLLSPSVTSARSGQTQTIDASCLQITPRNNQEPKCIRVRGGFIVANTNDLSTAMDEFERSRARFAAVVGQPAGDVIYVVGLENSQGLFAKQLSSYGVTLSLPTAKEKTELVLKNFTQIIRTANPQMPEIEVQSFAHQGLQRLSNEGDDRGIFSDWLRRHELCHTWLILKTAHFDRPARDVDSIPAYGTVLPDWLDEAVAVSCEADEANEHRMKDFLKARQAGALRPLAVFLREPHPRTRSARPDGEQSSIEKQGNVTIKIGVRPAGSADQVIVFYAQAWAVSVFLREMTGRQDVLGLVVDEWTREADGMHAVLNTLGRLGHKLDQAAIEERWLKWSRDED